MATPPPPRPEDPHPQNTPSPAALPTWLASALALNRTLNTTSTTTSTAYPPPAHPTTQQAAAAALAPPTPLAPPPPTTQPTTPLYASTRSTLLLLPPPPPTRLLSLRPCTHAVLTLSRPVGPFVSSSSTSSSTSANTTTSTFAQGASASTLTTVGTLTTTTLGAPTPTPTRPCAACRASSGRIPARPPRPHRNSHYRHRGYYDAHGPLAWTPCRACHGLGWVVRGDGVGAEGGGLGLGVGGDVGVGWGVVLEEGEGGDEGGRCECAWREDGGPMVLRVVDAVVGDLEEVGTGMGMGRRVCRARVEREVRWVVGVALMGLEEDEIHSVQ
ncbi:uncharacterized protein K452DRAFT_307888 [Aplosporella prunicola CBS 121167]|uniref:Uncharacterized protein n=1 Tax=Aplosporella prunicola CBS 121167 TaxID=1176127 RepID=A0A6A6BG17_9PEZI|nr:uncharacterized protein K452DRAFT_307888 [Aplosporella prunicola CBS 121167]KAF2143006.1 hypothetical protein K452DRAFT_307888 [Aplosporella prunicola CBS 121167]